MSSHVIHKPSTTASGIRIVGKRNHYLCTVFQSYRHSEAGDTNSKKSAKFEFEHRTPCSESQEINHYTMAAPKNHTLRRKGRYLTQSYDKSPCTHRKTQNRHQNFDYTTIAYRLRTVSWSNDSFTTCVIKPIYSYVHTV